MCIRDCVVFGTVPVAPPTSSKLLLKSIDSLKPVPWDNGTESSLENAEGATGTSPMCVYVEGVGWEWKESAERPPRTLIWESHRELFLKPVVRESNPGHTDSYSISYPLCHQPPTSAAFMQSWGNAGFDGSRRVSSTERFAVHHFKDQSWFHLIYTWKCNAFAKLDPRGRFR